MPKQTAILSPASIMLSFMFSVTIGFLIQVKAYGIAAFLFIYGLGLALGTIVSELQALREDRKDETKASSPK